MRVAARAPPAFPPCESIVALRGAILSGALARPSGIERVRVSERGLAAAQLDGADLRGPELQDERAVGLDRERGAGLAPQRRLARRLEPSADDRAAPIRRHVDDTSL